jgi:fluoride exporter
MTSLAGFAITECMQATLLVFLGAGFGGALRHGVNIVAAWALGTAFPWGTLAVNVIGGLAMGVLAGWLAAKAGEGWTQPVRLFLATGILGGFTTFSAFSLDAVLLWERGQPGVAAAYIVASVALSIGGLVAGLGLARTLA